MFDKRLTLIAVALGTALLAPLGHSDGVISSVAEHCEPTLNFNLLTMHVGEEFPFSE